MRDAEYYQKWASIFGVTPEQIAHAEARGDKPVCDLFGAQLEKYFAEAEEDANP